MEYFEQIEKKASESIIAEEGDYIGKDGLLYCHKCNTRKQTRIEILGIVKTPMCMCKCMQEKKEKEEAELKQRELTEQIERMRIVGFPDSKMSKWTFEADDRSNEKISNVARNYVENFEKLNVKGLLFYGDVGTGKTFISSCIANALIDKGHPCLVTNFARLVNTLQGMYEGRQNYIDGLDRYDLLVIDDLASERDTEYMNEIVTNIIDARYRSGKALIVTTNLKKNELNNPSDVKKQRIYSRLFEMCVPVEVLGPDRRKMKMVSGYAEMKEILGL